MQQLQLILVLGLFIYTIYSVITYTLRRSGSKASLRDLARSAEPLRQISDEERACIQPFLTSPTNPTKPVELSSGAVLRITGPYLRHGLESNGGTVAIHDTIGGVDVVLPYDANLHLAEDNVAEVVLTREFAMVLRLNDSFDVIGGRARHRDQQALMHQWREGRQGELGEPAPAAVLRDAADTVTASAAAAPADDHTRVHILGQRDETPAEAAARDHPGFALLALLPLLPAFILILVAGFSDEGEALYWFMPALLLLALALAMIWHKPGAPARQKVNRVQGTLNVLALSGHQNSVTMTNQLFLGDKFLITLPAHWQPHISLPPDSRVDVDMRVEDQSIVRFGNTFSLDAEQRLFPNVYWGRHLVLTLVGAAMLLIAWSANPDLGADFDHAGATLGGTVHPISDADAVKTAAPAPGSMVQVSATVQCQIAPPADQRPGEIDCNQVRLQGDPLRFDPVTPDATVLALYQGELLRIGEDPRSAALMEVIRQRTGSSTYNPFYGYRPRYVVVHELSALVLAVEQVCAAGNPENAVACFRLRDFMGTALQFDEALDPLTAWATLLASARDGRLARRGDTALLYSDRVGELRQQLRAVSTPLLQEAYLPALQTLLDSQRGGVVLPLGPHGQDYLARTDQAASPASHADWVQQWAAYQAHAAAPQPARLELTGMVVGNGTNAHGDTVLEIDPTRTPYNGMPAVIRLFALLLGAAFVLGHGALWVRQLRRAQAREHALAAWHASRI